MKENSIKFYNLKPVHLKDISVISTWTVLIFHNRKIPKECHSIK